MATSLSLEQRRAIENQGSLPLEIKDELTGKSYYLFSVEQYERIRSLHDADDFDVRDLYPLMSQVARDAGWDDPEMNVYREVYSTAIALQSRNIN